MKRIHYIIIASVAVIIIAFLIFKPGKIVELKQLLVKVEKGQFEVLVTVTGEPSGQKLCRYYGTI